MKMCQVHNLMLLVTSTTLFAKSQPIDWTQNCSTNSQSNAGCVTWRLDLSDKAWTMAIDWLSSIPPLLTIGSLPAIQDDVADNTYSLLETIATLSTNQQAAPTFKPNVQETNACQPPVQSDAVEILSIQSVDADSTANSSQTTTLLHSSTSLPVSDRKESQGLDHVCIDFTFDNADWTFTKQYPWGSDNGTFGALQDGKMCVTTNDLAGGALFIGTTPNPGPGNTKFECFFPTAGQASCDISLVDGYSLSVQCISGTKQIGGPINLWEGTSLCEDIVEGHCVNTHGYAGQQSEVGAFFQPAVNDGNEYCIWVDCPIYSFPVTQPLSCHISGTPPA